MDRRGRVEEALGAVTDALSRSTAPGLRQRRGSAQEDWLEVVQGSQGLVNRLTSVQDVAIASAARFEGTYEDDGTVGAVDRGPGRVAPRRRRPRRPSAGSLRHRPGPGRGRRAPHRSHSGAH